MQKKHSSQYIDLPVYKLNKISTTRPPRPAGCATSKQRVDDPEKLALDCPVLCTHCSKLPGVKGLPMIRGLYRANCTVCGVTSCCRLVEDEYVCVNDPGHETVMAHNCSVCDASNYKFEQLIILNDAVPYSFNLTCDRNAAGCNENLVTSSKCGHVFCENCFKTSMTVLLRQFKVHERPSKYLEELVKTFVTDEENFIVPPCPTCYSLGAQNRGVFSIETLRMLEPDTFIIMKRLANLRFHLNNLNVDEDHDPQEPHDIIY